MVSRLHELTLPLDEAKVRALNVGDMVTLTGNITVSIGIPTHKRMAAAVQAGEALPVDLRGGAFFHLSTYVRDVPEGSGPGGTATPLYMNPSTSTRYNEWMPDLIQGLGLRLVGGKGGLDAASVQALKANGCAYLSFLGGGSPLLSRGLREVVSSHYNEYISQFRLLTVRVESMGPATVAIDANGNSVYDQLMDQARHRMPAILAKLAKARQAASAS